MPCPTRIGLGASLLLVVILCGCGYRVPDGDVHPDIPFFPKYGGDSGFVVTPQLLAGAYGLQVRLLQGGDVEITSEDSLPPGDSLRTLYIQRFDTSGRELWRRTATFVASYESNPRECSQCSDGRFLIGSEHLLEADSSRSPRRIEPLDLDGEWMVRTYGLSLEGLQDSVRRIGEGLDQQAGNHLTSPKSDSIVGRLDSLVYAQWFREFGIDSLRLVENGPWSWVLGIDRDQRPRRSESRGALANLPPAAVRCSSLLAHPRPESPLRAWDSSVITNTSTGNHYVFGFVPQWMTYHRIRILGRQAQFKLYDHDSLGPHHLRYSLKGEVTLPNAVWIVAGRSNTSYGATPRDTLYRIRLRP